MSNDVEILDVAILLRQSGQFMEVGGEEAECVYLGGDVSEASSCQSALLREM